MGRIESNKNLQSSLKNIKAAVFDVDGTMTNGSIWMDSDGVWRRHFSVLDGAGIISLKKAGYITGVITAADSEDVRSRIKFLNIKHFYEASFDKLKDFYDLQKQTGLTEEEICYIGDDLSDIPVLEVCGFSVCPKNAVHEVKNISKYITESLGGEGAVRELCDILLKYGYHSL